MDGEGSQEDLRSEVAAHLLRQYDTGVIGAGELRARLDSMNDPDAEPESRISADLVAPAEVVGSLGSAGWTRLRILNGLDLDIPRVVAVIDNAIAESPSGFTVEVVLPSDEYLAAHYVNANIHDRALEEREAGVRSFVELGRRLQSTNGEVASFKLMLSDELPFSAIHVVGEATMVAYWVDGFSTMNHDDQMFEPLSATLFREGFGDYDRIASIIDRVFASAEPVVDRHVLGMAEQPFRLPASSTGGVLCGPLHVERLVSDGVIPEGMGMPVGMLLIVATLHAQRSLVLHRRGVGSASDNIGKLAAVSARLTEADVLRSLDIERSDADLTDEQTMTRLSEHLEREVGMRRVPISAYCLALQREAMGALRLRLPTSRFRYVCLPDGCVTIDRGGDAPVFPELFVLQLDRHLDDDPNSDELQKLLRTELFEVVRLDEVSKENEDLTPFMRRLVAEGIPDLIEPVLD